MNNFESSVPVPIPAKIEKDFSYYSKMDRPRQEIYEASKNLADYLDCEGIKNVMFLDNSGRQAYIGLKEIWKKEHEGKNAPAIYFMNPDWLTYEDLFETLGEDFQNNYKNIDKNDPIVIYDACIHSGKTIVSVKDFFDKMGFVDVRTAVTSISENCSDENKDNLDLICLDKRPQLGCRPFGHPTYVEPGESIISTPSKDKATYEKGRREHEAIKDVFK